MKSKKIFVAVAIVLSQYLCADAQVQPLDWDPQPKRHEVNSSFAGESAVMLVDRRLHEFKTVGQDMMMNLTHHKIVRVNNEKGVAMYNRVYIPLTDDAQIDEIKARVITPSGKVIELPQDKILDVEEEGQRYRKFALEGVETGSEVEYIIRQTRDLYLFGLEIFQNAQTPVQEAELMLAVPEHLVFTTKGYNGMKVTDDTIVNGQRIIYAHGKNIPTISDEKYGESAPYLQHVQYKLSYNLNRDKEARLYTWDQLAELVYSKYNNFTEKEGKAVTSFVKNMGIADAAGEEQRIILLEDYLKTNISINEEGLTEKADQVEDIIKTKVASHEGFIKLFVGCMNVLGIRHEIVFPNKRNEIQIDEELENYRLIEDLAFYFPGTKQYLQPVHIAFRYPFIDPYWAATRGLFLRPTIAGNTASAYARFDYIEMQSYDKSQHNIDVSIRFNAAMDSVVMHSKQSFSGYSASMYRPAFLFLPKDRIRDFTNEIMQSVSKSKDITNVKVENEAMINGQKNIPLTIEGDIASADLVEQAGSKTLFKIGDVIGPQVEMYQEKPRQLPVSIEFPHILDRTITLNIPDGYVIKNPEDLVFNIPGDKGEGDMGFVSNYKITGNTLEVKLHEFYKHTNYPMSKFKSFQEVINAAADFNKVVLVLEKKK